MTLDVMKSVEIIEVMENYIARKRPPIEIRDKLDINYRLDNQSIILFQIRPIWNDQSNYQTIDYAKATFDKKNALWKLYWMRANQKWNIYKPQPTVRFVQQFLEIVDTDTYGCFNG
ncbi:DUF3024 domain-containing protein [Pollutibacter soli]|uniref:DUF3024 domain-containing protein n=1 Tax=Pollutibacter soli TaxID=3034157 RepID=UPI003014181D